MSELDYLKSIYELLQQLFPFVKLCTGVIQFLIVIFVIVILYKLFKLFF